MNPKNSLAIDDDMRMRVSTEQEWVERGRYERREEEEEKTLDSEYFLHHRSELCKSKTFLPTIIP